MRVDLPFPDFKKRRKTKNKKKQKKLTKPVSCYIAILRPASREPILILHG